MAVIRISWGTGRRAFLAVLASAFLAGCDQLGLETPAKTQERELAEAKAVGSACRHALRAIEDCYTLNPKAQKAAVFEGWREMDEYMRENKLEGIAPSVPRVAPAASAASKAREATASDEEDDEGSEEDPGLAAQRGGKPSSVH